MPSNINNIDLLKSRIDALQEEYNNTGDDTVEDEVFDLMVEKYEELTGTQYKQIGAKSREEDAPLPEYAPSLNKIKVTGKDISVKVEKDLTDFLQRYSEESMIIMDKYDGISLTVNYIEGTVVIQKRGDGIRGVDISFIAQYLQLPPLPFNVTIRGELMLFEKELEELKPHLLSKGMKATNSRCVVNGATSKVNPDFEVLAKCTFIPYSILRLPKNEQYGFTGLKMKQSEQLNLLKQWHFHSVTHLCVNKSQLSMDKLIQYLVQRRKEAEYRIDGLVLAFDIAVSSPENNENPHHAVAIKQDLIVYATVKDCVWNMTSKDGYLTPVIEIEPMIIITKVTYITLSNARMILNNKLGLGSQVAITQGGDIIPKFLWTITPSEITFSPSIPYHWDSNYVKIMATNPDQYPQIKCAKMKYFIDVLKIKEWGLLTILKLYQVGITNIGKLIRVTIPLLMSAEGIQEKGARSLMEELQNGIRKATMPRIMAGSCIFGESIGETICSKFIREFPSWRNVPVTYDEILSKRDFGPARAKIFSENLEVFKNWLNGVPELEGIFIEQKIVNQKLLGYTFIFTGFTDDILSQEIRSYGGVVKEKHWVKGINVVVAKDVNANSEKIQNAKNSSDKISLVSKVQLEQELRTIRLSV